MRSPRPSSTAFETYARFGATLEVWRRACGYEFNAVEPLLVPTDRLASTWPARLPSRPELRVVQVGEDRFRAVCDEGFGEPIDLSREQLVLHRVDERKLRATLCAALELTVSRDELAPLPRLLRIGQWRYSQAAGCAAWLACASSPADLAESLRRASSDGRPSIVLLFTRSTWTEQAERAAPADRVLVAAFDEVLDAADDGWRASDGWDAALGEFVRAANIRVAPGFREHKKKRVAQTGQTPAKLKDALREWYRSAKPALLDSGELLPAPEVKFIAQSAGVTPSTASRWLNGKYRDQDAELRVLWVSTADEHYIRQFKG